MLVALVVLGLTAGFAYRAGQKNATTAKAKQTRSASDMSKELFKNIPKKAAGTKPTSGTVLKTSSGFYRLSGTVKTIGKETITLTLTNGNIIVLTTKSTTPYYEGTTKYELSALKKGTTVMATGTIGADGSFTVTTLQKSS